MQCSLAMTLCIFQQRILPGTNCYSFTYPKGTEGWVGLSTNSVNNLLKIIARKRCWCDLNRDLWVTSPRSYHNAARPVSHLRLIDWSYLYKCKKTVVYTHVNGDTCMKRAKNHKQVILPIIKSPNINVLLNNITCLWFLLFFTCMSPLTPSSQLGHCQLDESQCHVITARRSNVHRCIDRTHCWYI